MYVIENFPVDIGPILNDYGSTGVLVFTNALLSYTTLLQIKVHYTLRVLQQAVFLPMK